MISKEGTIRMISKEGTIRMIPSSKEGMIRIIPSSMEGTIQMISQAGVMHRGGTEEDFLGEDYFALQDPPVYDDPFAADAFAHHDATSEDFGFISDDAIAQMIADGWTEPEIADFIASQPIDS